MTKQKGWLSEESFAVKLKGISCQRKWADAMSSAHKKYANRRSLWFNSGEAD